MKKDDVKAIDVHAHFGNFDNHADNKLVQQFMSAPPEMVIQLARMANTSFTTVSSLRAFTPRFKTDVINGNKDTAELVGKEAELLQWVVVNPLEPETYSQAERMLQLPKCVGIKIHPEEHGYPIVEHGRAIFEFAATHKAVIETHSGEQNSVPGDFVQFANSFPEVKLILSHLGCGWDGDLSHQVRAIQACKHGNIFTDTSSANSILPNIIEWAVKEIGADRILYATDSPLHFPPVYRARIDHADISDEDKRLILHDNAVALLDKITE